MAFPYVWMIPGDKFNLGQFRWLCCVEVYVADRRWSISALRTNQCEILAVADGQVITQC